MSYELYLSSVERTLVDAVKQFEELPDAFLREADLHAALYHGLQHCPVLTERYTTRDGRRTSLVHREYPTFFAYEEGQRVSERLCQSTYDLAVLNPAFVRTHDFEIVANTNRERAALLRALPDDERPMPLLAAIDVKLIEGLEPSVMEELESDFYKLVRSEPDAGHCYLAIFCRQWELNGRAQQALKQLEQWAHNYSSVSVMLVQSYCDDVGRIFGGRYLNLWNHKAPLPPLAPAAPAPAFLRSPALSRAWAYR